MVPFLNRQVRESFMMSGSLLSVGERNRNYFISKNWKVLENLVMSNEFKVNDSYRDLSDENEVHEIQRC